MRTTLLALLLFGALSSSAQNMLPAVPDTIVSRLELVGDRLVTSGHLGNFALASALVGGALVASPAIFDVEERSATAFYLLGGAAFTVGVVLEFNANSYKVRAGRILRNYH